MNPLLNTLQPYPFAKLRKLLEGAKLPEDLKPISLSIGEPKHPAPDTVKQALFDHQALFEKYPPTGGYPELKEAIGNWIEKLRRKTRSCFSDSADQRIARSPVCFNAGSD